MFGVYSQDLSYNDNIQYLFLLCSPFLVFTDSCFSTIISRSLTVKLTQSDCGKSQGLHIHYYHCHSFSLITFSCSFRSKRGMEGRTNPETGPSGLSKMSTEPEQHIQTDSFLTAARLLRRAWVEEEKKTGRQLSHQPRLTRSTGSQSPKQAEISSKDLGTFRKIVKVREEDSEDKTDGVNQTTGGTSSAHGQTDRKIDIVLVLRSGCRTSCRQNKRLKAPILPVISEMN